MSATKTSRKTRTLEELWNDAEPVGVYKDCPGRWGDGRLLEAFGLIDFAKDRRYEVRRRSSGALIARITSPQHERPEFQRLRKLGSIEGYTSKRSGRYQEPDLVPADDTIARADRRRRLRELHPDRLGREQTPAEREEFTRLAGGAR